MYSSFGFFLSAKAVLPRHSRGTVPTVWVILLVKDRVKAHKWPSDRSATRCRALALLVGRQTNSDHVAGGPRKNK